MSLLTNAAIGTLVAQFFLAAAGTLSFAILFACPRRLLPYCALVGGVGWLVYELAVLLGADSTTASLLAVIPLTLLTRVLAILLNELRSSRMRKLVQVSTYLPHFLSWVVIAGIFINILSPTGGILNDFRALFGLPAVDYMTQKDTIMGVLFASSLWRSLGWDSIIYFAAIIGINQSLYEAAYMDGATRMQVIRYVVLPALITPMVTTFILNLGFFLDAGFDQVFNFTNDAVNSTIDILDTYIYRLGLTQGQYEVSTAVGLLKGVVGVVLVLITHGVSKKLTGTGVW